MQLLFSTTVSTHGHTYTHTYTLPHLHELQGHQDLVRKAADEAHAQPTKVVVLQEVVQVDGQQLKADTQMAAEHKVVLRPRSKHLCKKRKWLWNTKWSCGQDESVGVRLRNKGVRNTKWSCG
jgi:hypothetical protein